MLKVISCDYWLKEKLQRTGTKRIGCVHSVFNSAVNVEFGGRLITFFTAEFNQPGGAIVDRIPPGLEPGQEFEDAIDFSTAKSWREVFPGAKTPGGAANLDDFNERKKTAAMAASQLFGKEEVNNLMKIFAGKSVKEIVGAGEGLTPAGDDFLIGKINAAHFEKIVFGATVPAFGADAGWLSRTNDISASFYRYAEEGRIGERAMNLLNAVYSGAGSGKINEMAGAFFKWGATSGKYHLIGLLDFQGNF